MKIFIFNFLKFIFVGVLLLSITGNSIDIILNKTVRSEEKLRSLLQCETLVIGSSHTQTAILPDSIPALLNISNSSETLYYTYNVLNTLLKNYDIKPDNIILDMPFSSLSSGMDIYLRDNQMYSKYLPAISDRETTPIFYKNSSFITYWLIERSGSLTFDKLKLFFNTFIRHKSALSDLLPYCGTFYASDKSNLREKVAKDAIKLHYDTGGQIKSDIQAEYLKKIVQLCKERKMHLFLLNTPLHKMYMDRIPAEFLDSYYSEINQYISSDNVDFWDYAHFTLPDSCFGDSHHLNLKGAQLFTQVVKKKLEEIKPETHK